MNIYLLRHAIAVPREGRAYRNDDRPLTAEGVKKMNRAARGIAKIVDKVDLILTSPLIRAHDTAKIAAKALGLEGKIKVSPALLPGTSPAKALGLLKKSRLESVMIVGHEPDLGKLGAKLLGLNRAAIDIKKGSLCLISAEDLSSPKSAELKWLLTPRHLQVLGTAKKSG